MFSRTQKNAIHFQQVGGDEFVGMKYILNISHTDSLFCR